MIYQNGQQSPSGWSLFYISLPTEMKIGEFPTFFIFLLSQLDLIFKHIFLVVKVSDFKYMSYVSYTMTICLEVKYAIGA